MSTQPIVEGAHPDDVTESKPTLQLLHNRAFALLWSGRTISYLGDTFFNLTIAWVVYSMSGSVLQTAIIQVVWHLPNLLFGPLAGVLADRWDRKRIMVLTNVLAALIVGVIAVLMFVQDTVSPVSIFVALFVLNSVTMFFGPANFSIMPEVVGRKLLTTASGLFAISGQVAALIGGPLSGMVIAVVGAVWTILFNAISFLIAAVCIAIAPLPSHPPAAHTARTAIPLWRELQAGWQVINELPILRILVWLSVLLNVTSFTGPMWPALVSQQLQGDATTFGILQSMAVVGGLSAGLVVGKLERQMGAGRIAIIGWIVGGTCTLGIAFSTSIPLTGLFMLVSTFGSVVASIAFGALSQTLCPPDYRGRLSGISSALAVLAIPPSALLGGWLADLVGVTVLFAIAGIWTLGVAGLAQTNRSVRTAKID